MKAIRTVVQKSRTTVPLGETTPIQLGFVIMVLGAFLAAILAAVWWASAMNAKLDMVVLRVSEVEKYNQQLQELRTELRVHMASEPRKGP